VFSFMTSWTACTQAAVCLLFADIVRHGFIACYSAADPWQHVQALMDLRSRAILFKPSRQLSLWSLVAKSLVA